MQPAGAGKTCFKGCIRYRSLAFIKQTFSILNGSVLKKFFWTHTGPISKQALKMKRTKMYFSCNLIQIWLRFKISLYIGNRFCNAIEIYIRLALYIHSHKFNGFSNLALLVAIKLSI